MTTRTVTVKLRAEVLAYLSGTKHAEKATKDLREEIERLDNAATLFTKSGLIAALAGLPGAVAPVAAGLAALPAFAITAGASFGVLALAVNGTGAAMKAVAEGDADKLQEAMAGLTDEAREFIHEYQRVKPTLDRIGDATQDAFFRRLNGSLEQLTQVYLPTMLNQMPRLASKVGQMGAELADFATAPMTVARINRQFDLASELTDDWTRFLRASIGLMLDLADAGRDFTKDTVGGLADGTEAMQRWVATARVQGQLNQIFENGGRILAKIGDIAAETGDLLMDMAANPALTDATLALLDILHLTLDAVHGLVNVFGLLPGPMQSTVATLLVVGGAALLLAGRVAAMKAALISAQMKLESLGTSGERAARGLGTATRAAGKAVAAFVALQIAGAVLAEFEADAADVDKLTKALLRLGTTGETSGEAVRILGVNSEEFARDLQGHTNSWAKFHRGVESAIPPMKTLNELLTGGHSFTRAEENIRAVDQALTQLVQNGNVREADIAFTRILQNSGKSLAELQVLLPNYTEAMAAADRRTDGLAQAQDKASKRAELLAGGLTEAVRAGRQLVDVFDELNGEALEWAEAIDNLEGAIDDAAETIAENGKTLASNSEEGRANRDALRDIAEATRDAMQARYAETGSLQAAIAVYQQGREAFIQAAMAAGQTREQAELLADTWLKMPTLVGTQVITPGLDQAIDRVDLLQRQLNRLTGSAEIRIGVEGGRGGNIERRWGGITTHARDGVLRQAEVFSSVQSGARYAFAEPGTGGEAFVPRNGDYGRSMSILDTAAGWYGATVMPRGGGQTIVHEHHYTVQLSSRELMSGFRREIKFGGGKVQDVAGSRPG